MKLANNARRCILALAATALLAAPTPVLAQEISESHLRAARAAITAMRDTEDFDLVLPQAAQALKGDLIQKDPHLASLITSTVDEVTLSFARRRGDLEREVATLYARTLTEEQLLEVAEFFSSETGRKLLDDRAIIARETMQAATIWQRGVLRDLAQEVEARLAAASGGAQAQQGGAEPGSANQ